MSDKSGLKIKRIYEDFNEADGYRVLVDRLWPRGISKEAARIDRWSKDLAPSTDLRRWFNHQPERFAEFRWQYWDELNNNPLIEDELRELASHSNLTLLYAAADTTFNHAVVLRDLLISRRDES